MKLFNPRRTFRHRTPLGLALLSMGACFFLLSGTAAAATTLPDTPVGRLATQVIHHINTDDSAKIRQWAPGILSASIPTADTADFLSNLGSAARDSGGVEVIEVRASERSPGMLQITVKARRSGKFGVLVLAADSANPGQLAQAVIVPVDDPGLYADWPKAAVPREELANLIRRTLDRLVRTDDFSGCITVTDNAGTVFDECRGLAERRFSVPIDKQTKFHIASVGKMFTAVAIAQLVESGKLSWDATLAQLVPEYPDSEAAKAITVWQLLHHTAGLGDYLIPEYFQRRDDFINLVDYVDFIARQPKMGEPGKEWNYSNSGYVLLGRIIEKVSGEDYYDYMQRRVFTPAGMTATGFDRLDEVIPKLSVGYYRDGAFSTEWKADWLKLGVKGCPAGGGYSTNTDLLRFAAALRDGRLIKPATLAKMFDGAVPAGPGVYAAGFGERLSHGSPIRGHAGGIEGTTANLQMVWNSNAAVALTSNEGPAQTWMLAERIADLLAAQSAKP